LDDKHGFTSRWTGFVNTGRPLDTDLLDNDLGLVTSDKLPETETFVNPWQVAYDEVSG
jgi:hypothetical protein